jgi:hypothetical protein
MAELKFSTKMQKFFNDTYRWRMLVEPLRARDALLGDDDNESCSKNLFSKIDVAIF